MSHSCLASAVDICNIVRQAQLVLERAQKAAACARIQMDGIDIDAARQRLHQRRARFSSPAPGPPIR
jgi:hypothetical protein